MRIVSVNYNVLNCNEINPDPKSRKCAFQFRRENYNGLFSRTLLSQYIRAQYNSLRMAEYNNTYIAMAETLPIENPSAFKSEPYNYYFQLNDGYLKITYEDETEQIVSNSYNVPEWTDYKNVWTYDKNCIVEMHDKSYFLWLSLVDVEPEDVNIKVLNLKCDGVTAPTYNTTLSGENMVFVCGQNFSFNGQRYDEYTEGFKSHLQSFNNVTDVSFYTESCASMVLVEKK